MQAIVFNRNGVAKSFQVNFYAGTAMPKSPGAKMFRKSAVAPSNRLPIDKGELPSWLVVAVDVDGRTPDQTPRAIFAAAS